MQPSNVGIIPIRGFIVATHAPSASAAAAGRLIRPIPQAVPAPFAYWIAGPKATADEPKFVRFRIWLLEQAAGA